MGPPIHSACIKHSYVPGTEPFWVLAVLMKKVDKVLPAQTSLIPQWGKQIINKVLKLIYEKVLKKIFELRPEGKWKHKLSEGVREEFPREDTNCPINGGLEL